MASAAKYAKSDFSNVLHEELKCFICQNGVIAGKHHWYRCVQGHTVCQDCKEVKEKEKCSCNKPFVEGGHCKILESLLDLDKMQFKCENLPRGCQEKLGKESMIFHQTECIYRRAKCPRMKCESQVPFHELLEHMKQQKCIFPTVVKMRFREKLAFATSKEYPAMIEIESKTFLSCVAGVAISQGSPGSPVVMIHHWIYFVGSPQEAKHYSYTLEYQNEEQTTKTTFVGQVISIDETTVSIIKNGNCFGISALLFSKFAKTDENNGRTLMPTANVTIRNLKEEAKDENVESGISDNDQ